MKTPRVSMILAAVLLAAGSIRLLDLLSQPTMEPSISHALLVQRLPGTPLGAPVRPPIADLQETTVLALEQFDPTADVLLTSGQDQMPGRRGIDDDFDDVVDNASELGAFLSDDECLAPTDAGYDTAPQQPFVRVISRGAFVPAPLMVVPDPAAADAPPRRIVVHGQRRSDVFVWPVDW